jgi:hypothetical protein
MAKETLLWTALPNGYTDDGKSLRISILLSPRLEPDFDPYLGRFPDFIDWPATLATSRIALRFGGKAVTVGDGNAEIDDSIGLPDSDVWKALFPDPTKMFVRGFAFRDLSKHGVLSYAAADMHDMVRNLYGRLAASAGDQLPTVSTILSDSAWKRLIDTIARNDQNDSFTDYKHGVRRPQQQFEVFRKHGLDGSDVAQQLTRFQLYHTPPSRPRIDRYKKPRDEAQAKANWLGYERTKLPAPNEFKDQIDFHQIVAAMNQYPTLLRKLGLVVDLLVARKAFNASPNALLWAEVELPDGVNTVERSRDASPRTHTRLDAARFQSVPRPPQPGDFTIVNGLLDINAKAFDLLQADVDAAGLKVTNFARTLARMDGNAAGVDPKQDNKIDPVTKLPREIGAPALRNAGLMLVQKNRADMLKNNFARQLASNKAAEKIQKGSNTPPPEMFGEDLVRGYRIDIWDDVSRQWRSLCRRKATYNLSEGEAVIKVKDEEGTLRLAATTSPDPGSNPDIIWLHEALVSWTGWSLCAPPPGRTISHDGSDHSDPVTDAEPEVPEGLPLQSVFRVVAGSLPRLRYGRKYWMRARVVDLAGNSLAFQPKDFGPEDPKTNARMYLRYEPISAPALALLKTDAGVTEAPSEGESMERMAVRSFNDVPTLNSVTTSQRARRFAVPSRTNQREAEHHGMLDLDGIVDPASFSVLAAKDNSLVQEKILSAGPLAEGPPVETGYAVMQEGEALPYLPDPLTVEIAARIFNHPTFSSNEIITIPLYPESEWPDARPFKIEIYEEPADKPHFDTDARTLFIPLPKAARATLRLSVQPSADALRILGVWNWLTDAQKATREKMARNGQHWMLTPWRNIELVHAVQRPLVTPEMKTLQVNRALGATQAIPTFEAFCSIASTDHLDLRARWNEPFEEVAGDKRENRARTDHAFGVKITEPKSYAGPHEFVLLAKDVIRAGGFFDDRVHIKVHEFNDTRYRRIEYWLDATTKFREFMPASLLTALADGKTEPTDLNLKVSGSKVRKWIYNSAPPPAPDVLYVVPTFGWVRSGDENTKTSWRRGGGLRVYLKGPWNVSGYGEMLGVILPRANLSGDPDKTPAEHPLNGFVTQWGNDPIWLSPFVPGIAPKRANFPLARFAPDPEGKWLPAFAPVEEADQPAGPFSVTDRQLPDLSKTSLDAGVEVAPHDVFYDEERKLWYCDIEITWGMAYYPFIRLALARYHPVSVEGAHLSHVVLADFMPLVPDRWLNVTQTQQLRTRHVKVFGHTYTDSSPHTEAKKARPRSDRLLDGTILNLQAPDIAASSVIEVWVERFDPALGEDFGWKRDPDAIVQKGVTVYPWQPIQLREAAIIRQRARAKELYREREFAALVDERLIDKIFVTPTLWDGSVTLPQAPADGVRYRLAIAEFEEYLVDDDRPYDPVPTKKDRRLVFMEYVELA